MALELVGVVVVDLTGGRTKRNPGRRAVAGGVPAAGAGAERTPTGVGTAAGLDTAETSEMQKVIDAMTTRNKCIVMMFFWINLCCSWSILPCVCYNRNRVHDVLLSPDLDLRLEPVGRRSAPVGSYGRDVLNVFASCCNRAPRCEKGGGYHCWGIQRGECDADVCGEARTLF